MCTTLPSLQTRAVLRTHSDGSVLRRPTWRLPSDRYVFFEGFYHLFDLPSRLLHEHSRLGSTANRYNELRVPPLLKGPTFKIYMKLTNFLPGNAVGRIWKPFFHVSKLWYTEPILDYGAIQRQETDCRRFTKNKNSSRMQYCKEDLFNVIAQNPHDTCSTG